MNAVLSKFGPEILEEADSFGWTPLHLAAYLGFVSLIQEFLETKSYLAYKKNKEGMSALHLSAMNGNVSAVKKLMEECPDVGEIVDNRNRTALHIAAETGQSFVVKAFFDMRELNNLINEKDREGNTAFHLAALNGHYGIIITMSIDNRVDKAVINNYGLTAIDTIRSSTKLSSSEKVCTKVQTFPLHNTVIKTLSVEKRNTNPWFFFFFSHCCVFNWASLIQ